MHAGRLIRRMFRRHNRTTRRLVGRFERSRLQLNQLEDRRVPATITVTGTTDGVGVDGVCSLREAINAINNGGVGANSDVVANTTGTYGTADSITFSTLFNSAQSIDFGSQITIGKSMTVTGKGESLLTLQNVATASASSRLFQVSAAGTATVTLEKMTLTGGNLTLGNNGGAILSDDEDLRLTNVTVINNKTDGSGGAIDMQFFPGQLTLTNCNLAGNSAGNTGGAINVESYSTITVNSSTISNNQSFKHGGVFHVPIGADSVITINNSTLNTNTSGGSTLLGGAVFYVTSPCTITLTGSSFSGNTTFYGGSVLDIGIGACSVTVDSCTFTANIGVRGCLDAGYKNFSSEHSGGTTIDLRSSTFTNNIAVSGAAISMAKSGTLLIDRCQFTTNTATGGGLGGAIRGPGDTSTLNISNSSFTGNTAGGGGGALYLGHSAGVTTFTNTTFSGNTSGSGGGAMQIGSTASYTINNCTFSGNTAKGNLAKAFGGALFITSINKVTINNSTIVDNVATGGVGGDGGGIRRGSASTLGMTTMISTIVANNVADNGTDPDMSFPSAVTIHGGANLVGIADVGNFTLATTNGPNQTGASSSPLDPLLGALADNGGAVLPHTLTRKPLTGSPALNNGNQNGQFVDQAGQGRPSVGADIGAVQGVHPAPTAVAAMPATVTTAGGSTYSITVVYTDETGIDTATINAADITISGPGYGSPAAPNGAPSILGSGKSVTATYNFDAAPSPGGVWGNADNGTYTVTLGISQVSDTDTPFVNYAASGSLGTFKVAIPTTYMVDALGDVDDGIYTSGQQTLREALKRANTDAGTNDTITFSVTLNGSPIELTDQLKATDSVSIVGNGADKTIIDAKSLNRAFHLDIAGVGNVTMSGMKITGGFSDAARGGAILSADENLTLDGVWIDANQASSGNGAGIGFTATGKLVVQNSTISGNLTSTGSGAGIYMPSGGSTYLLVRNSTISGNVAGGSGVGGGIRIGGSGGSVVKIWNSTIANNNSASNGGGVSGLTVGSALTVESSIVAGNAAGTNIGNDLVWSTVNATNSFIGSGNDGHTLNVVGTTIAGTNATPANAMLGLLANNGGPTPTHLPNIGSPVRDIGSNPSPSLTLDQRGQPRSVQFGVDIGSVESVDEVPKATLSPFADILVSGATPNTVTVTFKDWTGINYTTIKNTNITILDPLSVPLTIVSATPDVMANGQVRVATYTFTVPGGAWDPADNGVYTIQLNGSEVFDIDAVPNAVAAINPFGSFKVGVGKVIVVDEATDQDDSLIGPNQLSIREAINMANADPFTPDTITFGGAAFAGSATIPILGIEFSITGSVTIQGTGASKLTIDGQNFSRIFDINDTTQQANVALRDMTLINGNSVVAGGAIQLTNDKLTLTNCILSNHTATTSGGAINVVGSSASGAALILDSVQLSGNTAFSDGGGIHAPSGPLVQIINSTISGNSASGNGGGFSGGYLPTGSFFNNSTISSNVANNGGGLRLVKGSQTFVNSTISHNSANFNGGGFSLNNSSLNIVLVMNNTIVANNIGLAEWDFSTNTKTTINGDHNLISIADEFNLLVPGPSNKLGTFATPLDPLLGPLQNNGGLTLTRLLQSGSPAINGGESTTTFTYDQRGIGYPRLLNGKVDMGAIEVVAPPTVSSVVFGDGTNQRSLVKQIVVTFSEPVNFTGSVANAFTVHRSGTGGTIGDVMISTNPVSGPASAVTITFSGALSEFGSLVDGLYDFTIDASQISGPGGNLDGDGIGGPGGNYAVVGSIANKFFRFFGDSNGDGTVSQSPDFIAFRSSFGSPSTIFDFDNDGSVDQDDFVKFRANFGGAP